ncbi:MAG: restriction endonuclease subunit S [Bacteroidia bacterium]
MSRGRKPFSSSKSDNWEKAFFNSIGHYITLINKGLSKSFKSEPLSNHIKIVGGFAFKNSEYKSSGVPIIRISDFNNERIVLDNVVYYEESPLLEKYELKESDIIIALTGGTIGKLGIVQAGLGKLYLNQRVGKFEILNPDEFEKEYIYWIARGVEGIVKNLAWGAAIPNVSPKQIEELNFPIPSKDIQKNIIRFLNDLRDGNVNGEIYFDEEIENEIKDIQEKQVKAREVQDELTYQLTQLDTLNQAILQEAVQGKLVPQDPKDEPASELLKRIKAEKAKSGKKEKPLPPINPSDIPFEIPENWVWCRLGEICEINGGYAFKSTDYLKEGYRVIRISDFDQNGFIDNSIVRHSFNDKLNSFLLEKENIILAMTGGTVGKSLYVESLPEPMLVNQRVATIKTINNLLASKYIDVVIKSWITQKVIHERKNSTNDNISMDDIKGFLIPLPPLAEQKRIVAEIEKQFAKTKQLKEHIIANQQATEQLLKALLHQAFEVRENKNK